ncbi:hypothetical protein F4779DRAFT_644055 [Xylariaceae sp. FL0662B]|nr:hypothetical protein F4779DRAFT_644055 [Xylariaceae sp. FL0662B]
MSSTQQPTNNRILRSRNRDGWDEWLMWGCAQLELHIDGSVGADHLVLYTHETVEKAVNGLGGVYTQKFRDLLSSGMVHLIVDTREPYQVPQAFAFWRRYVTGDATTWAFPADSGLAYLSDKGRLFHKLQHEAIRKIFSNTRVPGYGYPFEQFWYLEHLTGKKAKDLRGVLHESVPTIYSTMPLPIVMVIQYSESHFKNQAEMTRNMEQYQICAIIRAEAVETTECFACIVWFGDTSSPSDAGFVYHGMVSYNESREIVWDNPGAGRA